MSKKIKLEKGKLIITEAKEVDVQDAKTKQEVKEQLNKELAMIVIQVKQLKKRAEEIKEILNNL